MLVGLYRGLRACITFDMIQIGVLVGFTLVGYALSCSLSLSLFLSLSLPLFLSETRIL